MPKWTLDHFKIINFTGRLPKNKLFKVKLIIRFRNFNIQFDTDALFIHFDGKKRELIARFKNIPEEHKELLKYFSEALETGDMVNIDNVLRRVDMPVKAASTELREQQPSSQSFQFKRVLFSTLYLLVGAALFYFTAMALYKKFTQIEAEYAFISAPVIPVQSPYKGTVEELLVSKGNTVIKGQPLLKMDTSATEVLPETYKIDAAKQQIVLYQALIKEKKGKAGQVASIKQRKLEAAQSALAAANSTRSLKCNRRFEDEIDRRNPQKRNAECNTAVVKVSSAQSRVRSEQEALNIAYKQSKNSNASLKVLRAKLKQAQLKLKALKSQPSVNIGRETLYSAASGKIISTIENLQQYLKKGQVIALIQQQNSQQYVDAYLTQEKAAELKVGNKATVYSPLMKEGLPAVVKNIEFAENKLSISNRQLFNWSVPKINSAKVTLSLVENTLEYPIGLPVSVSIEKNSKNYTEWFNLTEKDKLAKNDVNNPVVKKN